jgi:hypothetical protein
MPGAGAVHHIKLGPILGFTIGPFFPRKRNCLRFELVL